MSTKFRLKDPEYPDPFEYDLLDESEENYTVDNLGEIMLLPKDEYEIAGEP